MEGEMIRAVVADDEKIIREGIAEWVDWNKLGICLVGCAKNGEEALAAVREHQADLLVTDIRMPGISGLELAEQLEREEKPPLIILISGYSDFAYAQKAVKLKCVVDYVLKPLELEQLEAVLAKTGQQILKRRHSILVPPVERTEEYVHEHVFAGVCQWTSDGRLLLSDGHGAEHYFWRDENC